MTSLEEKIKAIEEEIRKTPYHKATEHHIGRLRAKLAKLREKLEESPKTKGGKVGFAVKKSGDATVVLVGPPSVGKSTLLNKLTHASSKVGDYDFTTLEVIPGMLEYKGAKIQILDIPGLVGRAAKGKGREREILSVARNADLLLLMVDVKNLSKLAQIKKELHQAGVRLNQKPPKILIKKLPKGGIRVISQAEILPKTIKEIAREFGLVNAEIIIKDATSLEEVIDAFAANRVYLPGLILVNKIDLLKDEGIKKLKKKEEILISAQKGIGLDELKEKIFVKLNFIRIYFKEKSGKPDYKEPLILKKGATVADAIQKISEELLKEAKSARVWGSSVKYPGQQVGLFHLLVDEDILSF